MQSRKELRKKGKALGSTEEVAKKTSLQTADLSQSRCAARRAKREHKTKGRWESLGFYAVLLLALIFFPLMVIVADNAVNQSLGIGNEDRAFWIEYKDGGIETELFGQKYVWKR